MGVQTNPKGAQSPISQVSVGVGTAQAGVTTSGTYVGANAGVSLIGGNVSAVDFNVGAGVSTGVGIQDDSVQAKVAGCGVSIGRKMGISVFDNSISLDLGKLVAGW